MPAAVGALGTVFAGIMASPVGAALVRIGAGLALSALSRALAPKPEQEKPKFPGQVSEYTTGEGVPMVVAFGWTAIRGHAVGPAYSAKLNGDLPNKFLFRPAILSDLPITEIEGCYIDGDWITFKGTLTANKGYSADGQPYETDFHLSWGLGSQTSASAIMLGNFGGDDERPWLSDMIGRDKAIVYPCFEIDENQHENNPFNGGAEPTPLYVVKGAPLYDPRTETTGYTENPVVMIWNILRGIEIPGVGTWGLNVDEDDLPAAGGWLAAMDVCDEVTGGEARYRAGLEFGLNQEPLAIIDELLKACSGSIADCGGEWRISVGPPPASVYSFDDGDVIVTRSREFTPFNGLAETYNGVSATYRDPRNAWESTQAKPYYNATWEAEDGRRSVADVQYGTVPYPKQVRRLMRETGADNRRQRSHVISQKKNALHVMPLDSEGWTSAENGYDAKLFEVTQKAFDPYSLISEVFLRERDPSDYDFDEDFDAELPDPPSRINDDPLIVGVDGWDVEGVTITLDEGETGSEVPAAHCVWTDTGFGAVDIEIRLAATGQDIAGGRFAGERGEAYLPLPLFAGRQIEGRVRPVAAGRRTDWGTYALTTLPGNFITYGSLASQIKADIEAGNAEILNATRVARGIEPIEIVDTLPVSDLTTGRIVFLTTDDTLYRYDGAEWSTTLPPEDITGPIVETQIGEGAITTGKLAASAVTAGKIAAAAIGTDQLAANAITAAKIGAGQVTADKANFSSLSALGLSVVTADIVNANITNAKIANLAVGTTKVAASAISQFESSYVEGPSSTSLMLNSVPSDSYVMIVVEANIASTFPDEEITFVVTGASASFTGRKFGVWDDNFFATGVRAIGSGNRTLSVSFSRDGGGVAMDTLQLSAVLLKK